MTNNWIDAVTERDEYTHTIFKAEVIADNSGEWVGNGLTFETREQAEAYVKDLAIRWTSVRDTRVVRGVSTEPFKIGAEK